MEPRSASYCTALAALPRRAHPRAFVLNFRFLPAFLPGCLDTTVSVVGKNANDCKPIAIGKRYLLMLDSQKRERDSKLQAICRHVLGVVDKDEAVLFHSWKDIPQVAIHDAPLMRAVMKHKVESLVLDLFYLAA